MGIQPSRSLCLILVPIVEVNLIVILLFFLHQPPNFKNKSFNSKEELLSSSIGDLTVADKLIEQTGVIGEKLEIGSYLFDIIHFAPRPKLKSDCILEHIHTQLKSK